ncbi:hypothetical protein WJX75_002581 [Coccomyxa subellipsoidea]|uniref:AB hydrolase-1 domain-containing protein n=1 Tax=Coccomyxa subellipsoidea TaxID=248742 RepID=A0ABR2YG22_9CHLO
MSTEWKTGTQFVTTNDGVKIAFERMGRTGPVVVLLHGWSGSRHYYDRNAQAIAKHCQVYALDYRFHGDSDRPKWGYHVSRLAADLHDFLEALDLDDVTVVGSSLGGAVIWSYIELYGHQHLGKAVFVDQAPLQNIAPDWKTHSTGCYDAATLSSLRTRLQLDFGGVAEGVQRECLSRPLGHGMEEALKAETLRCDPDALGRLMADHTQLDWRPLLPRISIPCLNVVGRLSATFPWEGSAVVGQLIPNCHTVFFEQGNHFLYIEEPEKFNQLVIDFAEKGLSAVPSVPVVTPYPYGSIPAYHHPSVPLFPTDQLLFPSVHAAVKTLLPTVLPKLLGSLPFLQPGAYDIDTLLHDPQLLQDVFLLSAEAPAPGPSAEAPALSAEEAPALPASRPKSLIARKKAAARKDLQAEKHRQAILQALDLHASAPAPAPAFAQEAPSQAPASADAAATAPALVTPASFNAFFTQLNTGVLAPGAAPEPAAAAQASAPVVAAAPVAAP